MELFGALLGMSIASIVFVAIALGLVFPAFWLWMLIDSLVRAPEAYPSRDIAEKIMWVLLMVVLQPAAFLYFWVVWRDKKSVAAVSVSPHAPATA